MAVASSLPIEDTAEVAAAKEAFNAVFADAEAGGLAAKQAAQIADSYLADDEAVAAAGLRALLQRSQQFLFSRTELPTWAAGEHFELQLTLLQGIANRWALDALR